MAAYFVKIAKTPALNEKSEFLFDSLSRKEQFLPPKRPFASLQVTGHTHALAYRWKYPLEQTCMWRSPWLTRAFLPQQYGEGAAQLFRKKNFEAYGYVVCLPVAVLAGQGTQFFPER